MGYSGSMNRPSPYPSPFRLSGFDGYLPDQGLAALDVDLRPWITLPELPSQAGSRRCPSHLGVDLGPSGTLSYPDGVSGSKPPALFHPLEHRPRGLENVETIRTDQYTGLEDDSVDVAFLNDAFHDVRDQEGELHRVLKPGGPLSVFEHGVTAKHREGKVLRAVKAITREGLFSLEGERGSPLRISARWSTLRGRKAHMLLDEPGEPPRASHPA
ncbi:TPA: methyltransferase domain-containing protein [Candidatus Bathyarchaeota archaeon]|nr:methyltransferase domain-containing protein [Candidatus Bathyarchaeota archaeon]